MRPTIPTALGHLIDVLSSTIHDTESTTKDWERAAKAARWLEFEIAPLLAKLDLGAEVDGIAERAVEEYKKQLGMPPPEMLPIDSGINVVGQATITVRPQRHALRIERIVIPSEIALLFVIEDIKIGNRSQFAQSGALPATVFAQEPTIAFDVLDTAQDLVFIVRYIGADPAGAMFRAVVMGRPVTSNEPQMARIVERMRAAATSWESDQ